MLIEPSYSQFSSLLQERRIIPIVQHIPADLFTPISVFRRFATGPKSFLLESVVNGQRWSRYSIMGTDPMIEYTVKRGVATYRVGSQNYPPENLGGQPIEHLKSILARSVSGRFDYIDHFYCGLIGYFGYDFVRYSENLPDNNPDNIDMPDCHLMAPEQVIVFDHLKNEAAVIVNVFSEEGADGYTKAVSKIANIIARIHDTSPIRPARVHPTELNFQSHTGHDRYCESVERAKDYIRDGDIFQVVLSQRFSSDYFGEALPVYRALRTVNPSPYMFYFHLEDASIVGSSPEMLVRINDGVIETCPIAGTRPRGKTAEEDQAFEEELLCDEKEISEHYMLVDLARNDVGKVAEIGTVEAKNIGHVEKYSHVMHIVTNVFGKLREPFSPVDVLSSLLPAGTLSGAPKIRAMEIIDELEPLRRGLYGGAVGYFGFDGDMDTCITIRTALIRDRKIHVQAGAGIVADSDPEKEYEESMNKARALFAALEKSGGMR